MYRKIIALLAAVCICLSFAACNGESPAEPENELAKKEAEIRKAWGDMGPWYDFNDPATTMSEWRYYGEFEGYDVLFQATMLDMIEVKTIAWQNFAHGSSFVLYAYRNGSFTKLEDAYAKGMLSAESICDIAVIHFQHQDEIYGADYVEELYQGYEKPE